jgi:D-alanyl-D-alanine carboxypeptidase/D-alanyl-D-alanine-endopeptidase (penicillin-binding protein 4)
MYRSCQVLLLCIGFLSSDIIAQSSIENTLFQEVKSLKADPVLKYGHVAICIKSIKTGKEIVSENSLKNMVPASNLKLLTTAAALGILGENYTFQTKVEYDGEIKDSILSGNIYITGSGDPTLGSDRYAGFPVWDELVTMWAKKIKEKGIKKINGAVIADASLFELNSVPDYWPWGDMGNYYGAGIYGVNINENLYRIYFKGNQQGDSAQVVKVIPEIPGVKFVNGVKTGASGSGDNAYIYAAPRTGFIFINGTIPANTESFPVRGAVPDPPLLSAYMLTKALIFKKIEVEKQASVLLVKNNSTQPRKLICTSTSPSMKEIVKQTNVNSINLNAEVLLKTCGLKKFKDLGTGAGIKAVQEFWKQRGLETSGWFMYDGSGLSPNNGLSASLMCDALYRISKDSSLFTVFYNTLPIAGQTGTVARICKGTGAEGKIRVKSGTLSKVISYSGYFKSQSGEMYSFALFTNNYNCSNATIISKLEKIMVKMVEIP